ncbi:MAG: GNAT family N-acetyltransferase [Alphaproteobacteria bacterium]
MAEVTIAPVELSDAHELAPLLAAYTQDQKRGAPGAPDMYYAELLIKDPTAEILGARGDGRLIGFAVFLDLPDTMTGRRAGQLDDLFVIQDARERGAGHCLIEAVVAEGRRRRWSHMRWMVPTKPEGARQLAQKMAVEGPWQAFVIPVERAFPAGS